MRLFLKNIDNETESYFHQDSMKNPIAFVNIEWGKWMAVVGLAVFVGLAAYPLLQNAKAVNATGAGGAQANGEKKDKGGWAEKMMKGMDGAHGGVEVKAAGALGGRLFIGTKAGFFEIANGKAQAVSGAPTEEVKAIVPHDGKLVVGTKMGVYLFDGSTFKPAGWDLSVAVGKKRED